MPRTAFAALLLLTTSCPALAQIIEPRVDPVPSKGKHRSPMMDLGDSLIAEEKHIKARQDRIDAELKALDRAALKDADWAKEWAGIYVHGDGLGTNVSIHVAPKGGVSFLNYGCLGLYGGDHGDIVEVLPDGLRLKLRYGDMQGSYLSERVYFVKWDTERFLVPEWQMTEFVSDYNQGGFHRSQMYGIARLSTDGRRRFSHQTPRGLPELPPPFAKLLVTRGLELKITKASALEVKPVTDNVVSQSCSVDLASGSKQGVFVGMEFRYPDDTAAISGVITVFEVAESSSKALFRAFTGPKDIVEAPKAGEVVHTITGREKPTVKTEETRQNAAPKK